uniref:B30.2/SPRY domain-containing protein n=1 Tax=Anas platyrhynchos TaxID=8839 RepID=A0A8B9SWJ1_ANAPL
VAALDLAPSCSPYPAASNPSLIWSHLLPSTKGENCSKKVTAARSWAKVRKVGRSLVLSTARLGAVRDLSDVVLPCHLSPRRDARSLEVRWIRDEFSETVHHYHNGEDLYGEQMEAYVGRTELVRDGLSPRALSPATGADPHLSLGGYEAGGVRVLCQSAGWYLLPQLLWRDARGQHLPSVSQTHSQDQEGLFEIKGTVIVTGSVEGSLGLALPPAGIEMQPFSWCLFSAPFFHNAQPLMVLMILAVSIGLGVYLFRKQGKLAAQGWSAGSQEVPHLLPRGAAPGPELGKACPGLSSAPDGLAPSVPAVKVTLDPRTAHPLLVLSQDNCSVRWESKWQQVPNTPERFDTRCCVLGREEFREGRHYWEVEVEGEKGKCSSLAVGVARASVKRKGWFKMSPEERIWAVQYKEGQLTSLTSPPTPLSLSPVPTRIWVCLDCTQGQVSFINADNGVRIFIFTDHRGWSSSPRSAPLCLHCLQTPGQGMWSPCAAGQCRPTLPPRLRLILALCLVLSMSSLRGLFVPSFGAHQGTAGLCQINFCRGRWSLAVAFLGCFLS